MRLPFGSSSRCDCRVGVVFFLVSQKRIFAVAGLGLLRDRSAGAVHAAPPRRVRCGHCAGELPEVRGSSVLRGSARRLLLRQREPGPNDARQDGGRHQVGRKDPPPFANVALWARSKGQGGSFAILSCCFEGCGGKGGVPAGAADQGAAHPTRQGHQQHLHGSGRTRELPTPHAGHVQRAPLPSPPAAARLCSPTWPPCSRSTTARKDSGTSPRGRTTPRLSWPRVKRSLRGGGAKAG